MGKNSWSKTPEECWEIVKKYWPLSLWMIQEEILQRASLFEPIPENMRSYIQKQSWKNHSLWGRGCLNLLFVKDSSGHGEDDYLQESFVLPLIWKEKEVHSPCLPKNLLTLAQEVIERVSPLSSWGLNLNLKKNVDLHHFSFSCDSAFASLAGSLYLSMEGGHPKAEVWASAAWDRHRGMQGIDGLHLKMEKIFDYGGKIFFVAESNREDAERINLDVAKKKSKPPLQIEIFSPSHHLKEALYPYLSLLEHPPDKSRPLEERCNYYSRQRERNRNLAEEYYWENLLEELAEKCRKQGVKNMSPEEVEGIENLITFLSMNPTGSFFVLSLLKPKNILLFYTAKTEQYLSRIESQIQSYGGRIEKISLSRAEKEENDYEEIRRSHKIIHQEIQKFLQIYGEEKTAFDATPGPKDFTLLSSFVLDPKRSPFLYLAHPWDSTHSFKPGSEKVIRLFPGD